MKITSYYPVLMTNDVAATARFYKEHFGFKAVFEADWYVHLQSTHDAGVYLAVLDGGHETIPEGYRGATKNVLINFEVDDVDALHAKLTKAGLPIAHSLRDEAFGQRHFIVADPNGVLIDCIKPIPPTGEYANMFG